MSFSTQFLTLAKERSPFCLGLDPTPSIFEQWELPYTPKGLRQFCQILLEAMGDSLSIIKPQAAYFECFGPPGWEILQQFISDMHQRKTLVILDAKRGDIGSTSLAYAHAYLGPESPYRCDALTALAALGFESLLPMLTYARDIGAGIFIVVRSSNPEGAFVQNAMVTKDRMLADHLAQQITLFNQEQGTAAIGPIGAVIGATLEGDTIQQTLQYLSQSLILCPGIGYQGAHIATLRQHYPTHCARMIPASGRAVLSKGPSVLALQKTLHLHRQEALSLLS